jgi:pantothenate kinase-related protein Tda10
LTNEIQRYLQASHANARSAVLSLDGKYAWHSTQSLCFFTDDLLFIDLYHTHDSLVSLRQRHPQNGLLAGRGLPGTHDLDLARNTLDAVLRCNQGTTARIELPIFDKSAFGGEGDRSRSTISIETPIDVFVLEGWSMGFQALRREELIQRYEEARSIHVQHPASTPPTFLSHSLQSLIQVNEYLLTASDILYPPFSLLVQIRPESYAYVYAWRLQQERQLIATRGTGMSDAQVEEFVRRYMPGYELWAHVGGNTDGQNETSLWSGKSLVLWFGKERELVSVERP